MDFMQRNFRTYYNARLLILIFTVFMVSSILGKSHSKNRNNKIYMNKNNVLNYGIKKTLDNPIGQVRILPRHNFCAYNNQTYKAGRRFQPDPCTHCHCPRHGGRVQCFIQDCKHLANCIHYTKRPDQCCGICQQVGCKHTNGRSYMPGEVVNLGPCEKCKCPLTGGILQCDKVLCPQVACVNPVKQEGDCCETCPTGANCWLGNLIIPAIPGRTFRLDSCKVCQCPQAPVPVWMRGRALQAVCHSICL